MPCSPALVLPSWSHWQDSHLSLLLWVPPSSWDNLNFQSTSFLSRAHGALAMLFVEKYFGSLERCSAPGLPLGKTQTFASRTLYTWIRCSWVFTAGNTGLVLRYFSSLLLWFSRVAQYELAETVNSERIMRHPSDTVFCFLWVHLYSFHLFSYVHPDLAHNLLSSSSLQFLPYLFFCTQSGDG